MCGRYTQLRSWSDLVRLYRIAANQTPLNLQPRYNIAPTQDVPVVRCAREDGGRELVLMRWGLAPFWAKDVAVGYKTINARAETIAEKPAFRHAFGQRRCLIVADGLYEWAKTPAGRKQPYFISVASDQPFAFAGLWESWDSPDGERIQSCTIAVTRANQMLRPIHDRMPTILAADHFDSWLDMKVPLAQAKGAAQAVPRRNGDLSRQRPGQRRSQRRRGLPLEIEFLKGASRNALRTRSATTSVITGPVASPSAKDAV